MDEFLTNEEPLDVTEVRQVKRITLGHVFNSLILAFNMDRGGIYTVKQLFIKPGEAVRDYLGANRYHYTPPFRILIITTAIVLFAIGLSEITETAEAQFSADVSSTMSEAKNEKVDATEEIKGILQDLSAYFNLILWTFIPIMAFFTWLLNLKKEYNYAEHLVFQTYLFCVSNVLGFLFPLDHFMDGRIIFAVIYIAILFYYVYGFRAFLRKSWLRSFFESFFIFLISSVLWSVFLVLFFGILISFRMNA